MVSRSSIASIIFGTTTILGLGILAYFWFFRSKYSIENDNEDDVEEIEDVEEDIVEAEDVEEEDEGDEEHVKAENMKATKSNEIVKDDDNLRAQYDDIIRVAKKLLNGNAYLRAAEKFKEAIKLVEKLPSLSKDLVTLYNNSSAMYEKAGVYEESLLDISVVLLMDITHTKARARRARIYEAQGKMDLALQDYVFVMLTEQMKGGDPTAHGPAVDKLAKIVAAHETTKHMKKLYKNDMHVPLPTTTFCKQFFESFPMYYKWIVQYDQIEREKLESAVKLSSAVGTPPLQLNQLLTLICHDIYHKKFKHAYTAIIDTHLADLVLTIEANLDQYTKDKTIDLKLVHMNLSLYYDLYGSFTQLCCQLGKAEENYKKAILYCSDNYDVKLKLAMLMIELGQLTEVEKYYSDWLGSITKHDTDTSTPIPTSTSNTIAYVWILTHRSGLWIARDEEGKFKTDAMFKSIEDIEAVRKLTVNKVLELSSYTAEEKEQLKGAKYVALHKAQYIITHTAGQMAINVTEQQKDYVKTCMDEAILLFPKNDNVELQEIENLLNENDVEKAMERIDNGLKKVHGNKDISLECTYTLLKANVVTQQAFGNLMEAPAMGGGTPSGQAAFQTGIQESVSLYDRAIELEPYSTEALAAHAQLKSMMGEFKPAAELIEKALKVVRTREETQDLYQLYIMTKAQADSLDELQKSVQ